MTANSPAAIGANRKMVIFQLNQVPEMGRGRGVRLQRYKEKGLSDVTTFTADAGPFLDGYGRPQLHVPMKELKDWRGNRADAGRIAPEGIPRRTTNSAACRATARPPPSSRAKRTNSERIVGLSFVMLGLVPGIHVLERCGEGRRGWPGQARP